MSLSLEHDYIGFKEASENKTGVGSVSVDMNHKATELRLGLPGSESPERADNAVEVDEGKIGFSLKQGCCVSAGAKRVFSDAIDGASSGKWVFESEAEMGQKGQQSKCGSQPVSAVKDEKKKLPAAKAQVVGWPPIRSFRKNSMASVPPKKDDDAEGKMGAAGCLYIKVSMDGAPYLRKVDLKTYGSYVDLSLALEKMFSCFTIGQCGPHGVSSQDGMSESRLMDLLHGAEYVLTYEDKDGDWMLVGDVPWQMFTDSCRRMRIMKGSEAIGLAPRAMQKYKTNNSYHHHHELIL